MIPHPPLSPGKRAVAAMALVAVMAAPGAALAAAAADPYAANRGTTPWNLPPNYSVHGTGIDSLYTVILWITGIAFVLVQVLLVLFMVKYRHGKARRAHFTHGHTRLEMIWTLLPAVILALLALWSKKVWDEYRFTRPDHAARLLVVGEQFKWNVVYPGPDGKLGRYMQFPKPSDDGYRDVPRSIAIDRINDFLSDNTLGQLRPDHPAVKANKARKPSDPAYDPTLDEAVKDGKDDDYDPISAGRTIFLPANRPIDITLTSKDVLHDFFLPNFRVKLDAVPGLRGQIGFTATRTSTREFTSVDEVPDTAPLWLSRLTPGVRRDPDTKKYFLPDPADTDPDEPAVLVNSMESIADVVARQRMMKKDDASISPASVRAQIKRLGVTNVLAVVQPFELVCEELCGANHSEMRGEVIVLPADEYDAYQKRLPPPKPGATPPASRPAPVATAAGR